MRNYESENIKVIENTFARFEDDTEERIEEAMRAVLDAGVEYALSAHDTLHQKHIKMGDSYGWCLYHDSFPIDVKIFGKGAETIANVEAELTTFNAPSSHGWCGVIMAGMNPVFWFNYDYEIDILNLTIDDIKDNFHKYFAQI